MLSFFPSVQFFDFFYQKTHIAMWTYAWIFHLIPQINVSISVPISCTFHSSSSVVKFEVGDGDASSSSFIVLGCFSYPGFSVFQYEAEGWFSPPISMKNYVGILMQMTILMVLWDGFMCNPIGSGCGLFHAFQKVHLYDPAAETPLISTTLS